MNSKLDVNTLMERNKSDLQAAEETMPMVVVDNRNWTAVISLLMICFNLLGNGLRDALDPSLRGVEA